MRTLASILTCAALALSFCGTAAAQTARVSVVAAENFYGDVVSDVASGTLK